MADRWRRRRVVIPVAVVLVGGGSAAGWAATGGSSSSYRTAPVTKADVEQTLDQTGTITLDGVTKARSTASGTVAKVLVSVGDTVKAGQTLVTLEKKPLQDAVITATATLTKAQAQLEDDETSSSSSSAGSASSSSSTSSSGSSARPTAAPTTSPRSSAPSGSAPSSRPPGGGPTGGTSTTGLAAQVTSALANADRLLGTASTTCTATATAPSASVSASPDSSPSATDSASASASAVASADVAPGGGPPSPPASSDSTSCTSAVQAAIDALHQAQHLQAQLNDALGKSPATPSTGASTPAKGSSSSTASAGFGSTRPTTSPSSAAASSGSTPTGNQSSSFGGQSTQSAASRITTDTAAVQADQLALDEAKAALAGATLKSPVSGIVSAQPFTAGSGATKGQAVSITTQGAADVTIDVSSSSIRNVKVGQAAHVTADGAATPVGGTVSSIGLLPTSSSTSSTTTYPVSIHIADPGSAFVDGSQAQVSLVVASVKGAIVVPNSALHNGRVDVLEGTTVKAVRVEIGVVGELVTQVTSGLTVGQLVVLADLSQAVPTSSTSLSSLQRSTSGGPQFRNFGGNGGGFTRRSNG